MCLLQFRSLWWMLFLILLAAACSPTTLEPPAGFAITAAYPAAIPATVTLPPYPWPTPTPWPTDPPDPPDEPPPTDVPVPTLPPTPVVTPIPTAAPPIIPLPDETTPQPFTLFWRDGDVIRSLRSEGEAEPAVFLDPVKEFALYLTPEEAYLRSWGALSPDGRQVAILLTEAPNVEAYQETGAAPDIYILDRESHKLRLLVEGGFEPIWSPDGRRLAYLSGGLWIVDVESGESDEIYTPDSNPANPHSVQGHAWAPDGRHLALIDVLPEQATALILVDADRPGDARTLIEFTPYLLGNPQWSPSGRYIAFNAAVEDQVWSPTHVLDLDENRQVTIPYEIYIAGCGPQWSPTEDQLAFDGTAIFEEALYQSDIWLIDATLMDLKRLTYDVIKTEYGNQESEVCPLWSPDGSQLIYWKDRDVIVYSLGDGQSQRVTTVPWSYGLGFTISP
jgi:hypothetical protein